MSLGDDHQSSGDYGGAGRTRLRLPEDEGGPRRGGRSSSRSLVTVVGVVVLLIAAIAFANRGGSDSASGEDGDGDKPKTSATAPSGTRPVQSGFAHDAQGAQSAAANYAVALGSDGMFDKAKRDPILQSIIVPDRVADFEATLDKAYSPEFNQNVGLNKDGSTPKGYTFVSRTSPIGTKVTESAADSTTVEVWCSGLLGLAGRNSTSPVTSSWFTITMQLAWVNDDWKIVTHSQKDGPAPIPGDDKASTADEMAKAVQEYGGFTYAR
ncbi:MULTISPECIES: hypothetical protein [Streptomyces]|uniref:DUF8175 domain-containing protein n=1 Tax=Streptomyces violaceolatus TaxID=67378 RepID=A0ABN3TID4_9ACTN|nr:MULTISPECIES: hypothetical protein [Streptomyces]MBQ0953332.1 hypothetical protein [Streptomyces sp. RK76]MDX3322124.1 hypothetical protein [Streptomyces sp. ME03-5684b]WTE19630.1 hypothetical protein OH747_19115 [Streptomyces anthocyanicus]GGL55396.1 hypothetical protein GCM10010095_45530 [Streptomyces anthocyanicus]